jgi:sRNA-binding carbon storage regulator CsrA
MLVLGREVGEEIVVRDMETGRLLGRIRVCRIQALPGRVGLGFKGFEGIQIDRHEIDLDKNPAVAPPPRTFLMAA